LVQSLEEAGIPLDGLAAAIGRGELSLAFMDTEAYERFSSLSSITFQDLSEQTGVPVDLLMIVREASGSAQPTPQDRVRDSELAVVPLRVDMPSSASFLRAPILLLSERRWPAPPRNHQIWAMALPTLSWA
jgi:hypothetical protein